MLTSSAQNNRYLYTGREWDGAISLYHYRARMYDASLGRFCSKDPIGYLGGSACLYCYVGGRPVGSLDPSGMLQGTLPGLPLPPPGVGIGIGGVGTGIGVGTGVGIGVGVGVLIDIWITGPLVDDTFTEIAYDWWPSDQPAPVRPPVPIPIDTPPKGNDDDCDRPKCKPCKPGVGTIAYRIDRHPSPEHRISPTEVVGVPHSHRHQMNQSPPSAGCKCFWKKLDKHPVPGEQFPEMSPALGGGVM